MCVAVFCLEKYLEVHPGRGQQKFLFPVCLHVVIQPKLDVEFLPTSRAFILLVVSAALLLTIFPSMLALEIFPTISTERVRDMYIILANKIFD